MNNSKINIDSRRNFSKVKCFLFLAEQLDESLRGADDYLMDPMWAWRAPPDIASFIGVSPGSLRILLKRWAQPTWHFVDAYFANADITSDSRGHWFFKLSKKGRRYVEDLPKWYKRLNDVREELRLYAGDDMPSIRLRDIYWEVAPKHGVAISFPFSSVYHAQGAYGSVQSWLVPCDVIVATRKGGATWTDGLEIYGQKLLLRGCLQQ